MIAKQKAKQFGFGSVSMDIADRIREIRGEQTREQFSQITGIHSQTLYKYENRTGKVSLESLEIICKKFNVCYEWLITGEGPMHANDAPEAPDSFVKAHECDNDADLIMIPRVSARLCAGTGSLETDDNVVGMYAFRADWILKKGNTKRMVLMDVTGDSMAPDIKHGDIVLVDQSKTDIYGHGYYAVGVEDAIYIKEIMTSPGMLVLKSINPRYEDIKVSLGDDHASSVRIIGRVLWVGRELD